jgi:hypothetical protein
VGYRAGPLIEQWEVGPAGAEPEDRATIICRWSAGSSERGEPACLRLALGSALVLSGSGDRLRAIHAQNPRTMVEFSLVGGLSSGTLLDAIPPLPIPQACVVLDDGPAHLQTRFAGMRARIDAATGRFSELLWTGQSGVWMSARLLSTIVSQSELPSSWMIDPAGRDAVGDLTELLPLPAPVAVGDRVPAMGLFDDAWAGWVWTDQLAEIAQRPPQPSGTVSAIFVTSLLGEASTAEDAAALRSATKAAANVGRDLEIARLSGKVAQPRVLISMVGVLEVADVGPAIVQRVRAWLNDAGVDATRLHWTSIGRDAFHRMVPDARNAILVIDGDQTLRGVVRLDDRFANVATLEAELMRIVEASNTQP